MSFVSSGDHTPSPTLRQETAIIISVNLRTINGPITGDLRVGGLEHIRDIITRVVGRHCPDQDNASMPVRSLSEIGETEESARNRRNSRRLGRVLSSETRRLQRSGVDRKSALRESAEKYGRSYQEAEILVKLHHRERAARVEEMRAGIISRCVRFGQSNRQIAERLNVTPQHVGRIIAALEGGEDQ